MSDDEALVFKRSYNENNDFIFTIEQDEEIIKYIFEKYYKLLDNIENDSN